MAGVGAQVGFSSRECMQRHRCARAENHDEPAVWLENRLVGVSGRRGVKEVPPQRLGLCPQAEWESLKDFE